MLLPDPSISHDDHPAVRATVLRLRASLVAVSVGMVTALVLALYVVREAWRSGTHAATAAASGTGSDAPAGTPASWMLTLLVAGFTVIGVAIFVAVRGPYRRARLQAVELIEAQQQVHDTTLEAFAALNAAVEAKDRHTAGHGLRVTLVSILIGQELGLPQDELDVLRLAATFHDIGKIAVPDAVLGKMGRLSDGEFEQFKVHAVESARICSKLQVLHPTMPIVRAHHERMDGRGYPDGLVGEQIPLGSRVIAVADAWDAITSDRPYRTGQPAFVALEEIRRSSGAQFDERVVRAFLEVLAKDPWMFGLTPEDVDSVAKPLPAPLPVSRGVEAGDRKDDLRSGLVKRRSREIDWAAGFDEDDLRAA